MSERLRAAGHTVHAPDLFEGRVLGSLEEGGAHVERIGFGEITERGVRAAGQLPGDAFYAGFSLGVLPAQKLAQTRPDARGTFLVDACIPVTESGPAGPQGVPVRVHGLKADPFFARTATPPTGSSRSRPTRSCSCTPGTSTSSRTRPCLPTTRRPPPC